MKDFLGNEIYIGDTIITYKTYGTGLCLCKVNKIGKVKLTTRGLDSEYSNAPMYVLPENVMVVEQEEEEKKEPYILELNGMEVEFTPSY